MPSLDSNPDDLATRAIALRSEHPDWGYRVIAKEIGSDRHHVRRWIEHAERKQAVAPRVIGLIEPRTTFEFAERITACWRASVDAIIEVGRLLALAKTTLPHGEFGAMIESQLSFSASTAQRLMAIAADARLTNPAHVQHLPPAWGTLYELTKLDDQQFQAQLAEGKIRPDMERREAIKGARAIMGDRREPDDSLDFFPTPPWATRALMERVFPQLGYFGGGGTWVAWEPACGEGHISEVLKEYFKTVYATDLHRYSGFCPNGVQDGVADFLDPEIPIPNGRDWIITNPPFGTKTEAFVLRALDITQVGVAIFCRLQWLETIGRYERLFRETPPTQIAFFCERVNLCKGRWEPDGGTATAYIWLVWVKGEPPRPPFWIPPRCREAFTRPDDIARFAPQYLDAGEKQIECDPETGEVAA